MFDNVKDLNKFRTIEELVDLFDTDDPKYFLFSRRIILLLGELSLLRDNENFRRINEGLSEIKYDYADKLSLELIAKEKCLTEIAKLLYNEGKGKFTLSKPIESTIGSIELGTKVFLKEEPTDSAPLFIVNKGDKYSEEYIDLFDIKEVVEFYEKMKGIIGAYGCIERV